MDEEEKALVDSAGLTPMQAAFVRALATEGVGQTKAAEIAGYNQPGARAYELMQRPHILSAINQARQKAIEGDLAGLGYRVMRDMLADPITPAPVRFQCAKWAMETAGHQAAQAKAGLPAHERPLHEMSLEELEGFIQRGEQALSKVRNITPTIDISPNNAQDSAQD